MPEINKNTAAEQPEGSHSTPPEKQAEVQDNKKPEGQQAVKTSQTNTAESVWDKIKTMAGGEDEARNALEQLYKLTSSGEQNKTGESEEELPILDLTDDEIETWKALPGGEKVLKALEWLSKKGIQDISQQVRQIQEQLLVKQYQSELNELEQGIGRKLTPEEAELMYAVATKQLEQGVDASLKDIYNKYIKPLRGASEEEKKRALAEELNKTKQAPQVEGGGVSAGAENTPNNYDEYYKRLIEKGILKQGVKPQTFYRLLGL